MAFTCKYEVYNIFLQTTYEKKYFFVITGGCLHFLRIVTYQ